MRGAHDNVQPDIVAVCEIDKDVLLADLLQAVGLHQLQVIMGDRDTSNLRGVDVAVVYNPDKLELLSQQSQRCTCAIALATSLSWSFASKIPERNW